MEAGAFWPISTFVIHRSGLTVASGAHTGAVTLIQRFGSALNLNIHLHMLFLDGAYTFHGNRPSFHRTRRLAAEELNRLLDSFSRRILRVLERLCRYITRPPIATKRLSTDNRGRELENGISKTQSNALRAAWLTLWPRSERR